MRYVLQLQFEPCTNNMAEYHALTLALELAPHILVNAIADPTSRWPTVAVLGIILVGIPVYYFTVGKNAAGERPGDLGRV